MRYEARDTQFLAGKLADQGLIDGQRIGVTGASYGGGQSIELAALKDRYMDQDGNLHPWVSDGGHPMRIAAAAPAVPWTDLAYSLEPNGRTLDYTIAGPTDDTTPIGVEKQSFVSVLYALGSATGYYSPPAWIPSADLTQFARVNAGEPTTPTPRPGDRQRDHAPPLGLLPRPYRGPGAAADLQRLHRRPVPGRRGAALLQPHPTALSRRRRSR